MVLCAITRSVPVGVLTRRRPGKDWTPIALPPRSTAQRCPQNFCSARTASSLLARVKTHPSPLSAARATQVDTSTACGWQCQWQARLAYE